MHADTVSTQKNPCLLREILCRQRDVLYGHRKYPRLVSHSKVTRRHCVDTQKLLCTQKNSRVLTQKIRAHLLKLSCVNHQIVNGRHCVDTENLWKMLCRHSFVLIALHYLVYTKIFVCLHRVFLCKLVSRVLFQLRKFLFS